MKRLMSILNGQVFNRGHKSADMKMGLVGAAILFAGVCLSTSQALADGFAFNNISGPPEVFGPGAGMDTVPNAVFLSATQATTDPWLINTAWAINFIGGDSRCELIGFAPGQPLNAQPWNWAVGVQNFSTSGTFTYDSPDSGPDPISANYIIGFSSTAVDQTTGAKFVFDGNIDVTVNGLTPDHASTLGLLGLSAFCLLACHWTRRMAMIMA